MYSRILQIFLRNSEWFSRISLEQFSVISLEKFIKPKKGFKNINKNVQNFVSKNSVAISGLFRINSQESLLGKFQGINPYLVGILLLISQFLSFKTLKTLLCHSLLIRGACKGIPCWIEYGTSFVNKLK